ncbi:MAG: tRNA preQ1(34) S-adenosylmethionine ribosyltransferase-isomerase QueA [Deltaproteobacteria bacterium]|nr:tRNA preQ1(34) S-adenosylmethionine ribosyltransferase-isomerase QueA [Deltaproteobacteria bacterium]
MDLKLFQYKYPSELIAQHPLPERDASRMMVLSHAEKTWRHDGVKNLPQHLKEGDVLVLNNTRVFPARLIGDVRCPMSAERKVEILLLNEIAANRWKCLAKPFKKISLGDEVHFAADFSGTVTDKTDGFVTMEFHVENFEKSLEQIGLPPLPPYIKRKTAGDYSPEDKTRYQSVFAQQKGSAAAPTASLHFSPELLKEIQNRGVKIAYVTLHVSTDTFLPIREDDVTQHKMHGESFVVPPETQEIVQKAKTEGRRVIAVGTTAARALESDWNQTSTEIFIYPGYHFKIIDGLLTNFHQPSSTLLLLVSALAGREFVLQSYAEAIKERYRLFSYGDCMLIT